MKQKADQTDKVPILDVIAEVSEEGQSRVPSERSEKRNQVVMTDFRSRIKQHLE